MLSFEERCIIADAIMAMDEASEAVEFGLYDVALLHLGHHHAQLSKLLDRPAPTKGATTSASRSPQ